VHERQRKQNFNTTGTVDKASEDSNMKKEYDFSKMNGRPNPYASLIKKQITIRINPKTIDYFKNMAKASGVPYQTLIDSYLTDCAINEKKMKVNWG
jgi:predicted DNA binding CopG/RHH family protein